MQTTKGISMRKASLTIGFALIIMAAAAGIAFGNLHQTIFNSDSDFNYMVLVEEALELLRLEIILWLIVIITDIIVAWALHLFMRQFHEPLSLLAAWLRLIYTALLGISVAYLLQIAVLINLHLSGITTNIHQLFTTAEQTFSLVWGFGLIIFGIHLVVLAYIIIKHSPIHSIIGLLVFLAGLSYITIHLLGIFGPRFSNILAVFVPISPIVMALGELSLAGWFFVKGGRD